MDSASALPLPLSGTAVARAPRTLPPYLPLLVVALAWAAQGGVLRNGYVWDDGILLSPTSPIARGFSAIPELLAGAWGGAIGVDVGLYRPLVSASLAFQAGLHGVADPFPFHLVNLMLHGLAAVLFLGVLHRLLPTRPILTSSAALLFAAHPLHTGAVSWIVARGDLLAAVCALGAILVWIGRSPGTRGVTASRAVVSAVLYLFACLSKEAALPLPGVLLLLDAARDGTGPVRAVRTRLVGWVALVVALVCWGVLRASAGDLAAVSGNAPLVARSFPERLLIASAVLVRMAAKLFVPAGLVGDASNDPVLAPTVDLSAAYAAAGALVALVVTGLVVRIVTRRAGLVSASLCAFVLLALPVCQLVPINAVFEDRFAYLPSLALLPLCGLAVERIARGAPRGLALGAGVALLGLSCAACWAAAATWRDDEAFDAALLAADSTHLRALDRTARRRLLEGLAAKQAAERAPASDPLRTAWLARRASRVDEAVRLLERAQAQPRGRNDASILETLGDAYMLLPVPRAVDAKRAYTRHLERRYVPAGDGVRREADVLDPRRVPPGHRRDLGRVFSQLHQAEVAIAPDDLDRHAELLDRACFWSPDKFALRRAAAAAWKLAKRPDRALPHLERAVVLAGGDPSVSEVDRVTAERNLAETRAQVATGPDAALARALDALTRPGGQTIALQELRAAVAQRPDFVEAWIELAKLHKYQGNYRDAFTALDNAARLLEGAPQDDPYRALVVRLTDLYRKAAADADARGE